MPAILPYIAAIAAVAGTGYSIYEGNQQANAAEDAQKKAARLAAQQAAQQKAAAIAAARDAKAQATGQVQNKIKAYVPGMEDASGGGLAPGMLSGLQGLLSGAPPDLSQVAGAATNQFLTPGGG